MMGPDQKFSIFSGSGWVGLAIHGLGLGLKNFSLKMSKISIFFPSDQKKSLRVKSKSTWVKGGSASYLLRVKGKLGLGRVTAHLYCTSTRIRLSRTIFACTKRLDLFPNSGQKK